ncbi:membrane protein DedA with SNARE-associated domain [Tamaricihabitans halophyticus]|uniref:Membrane protein DedA with SNARE-associated domain n=1 Tax=Tamaricihabitans halophyticus TaxID=1262583 RepID=A0A4R2QST3_9PSEU|nr:DedA family protein [Tamaricihabitans halophyticus]TCP52963.1 membrane protein DedA with SNARE-associated domain [Tamaricihabitans halophyticus]
MPDLLHDLTAQLAGMLDSPWLWVVVFLVSGLDALLPFMPSESTIIAVGVFAFGDPAMLVLLIGVGAVGAFAGDCLGYLIGRMAGPRVLRGLQRWHRGQRTQQWATNQFAHRGPLLVATSRYVPGARVTTMLTAGILRYPVRRFLLADAAGVTIWAAYAALIGYLGGAAFADHPLYGIILGLAVGLLIALLIELGRWLLARRAAGRSATRTETAKTAGLPR